MLSPPSRGVVANLLQVLDRPGPLVILPHDNPDPDAMASAVALKYLVSTLLEKPAEIALGGIVGRAENRAMRTYLSIDLVPVSEIRFDADVQVALVDTQPGRPNNSLPEGVVPTVVIDHHPAYAEYPGVPFLDLREHYGATSTILTEYLREVEAAIEHKIATALFYGITAETQDLGREATPPTSRRPTSCTRTRTSGGSRRSRMRACRASTSGSSARRSTGRCSTATGWSCRFSARCSTRTWWPRSPTSCSVSTRSSGRPPSARTRAACTAPSAPPSGT